MKKNIKKTMISCFAGVGLMALCAGVMQSNVFASASTDFTGATQASATEFYEVAGASIRVDGNQSGIRFKTVLTKDYHNTLKGTDNTVEYITVMKSGTLVVEKTHANLDLDTYFATKDSLDLFASLTFNKDGGTLPDGVTWHDLYAWEFEVDTYAKVTASDSTITYYKAYETGTVRSMREVANAAYYDETGDHYQSKDIKNEYFKNLKEGTSTESYIKKVDGVSYLDITGAKFDETVSVYEGTGKNAKRVDGAYIASNGKIKTTLTPIVNENEEADKTVNEKWVTVFDADNNMYRHKINRFVAEYISDVDGLKNITINASGDGDIRYTSGLYVLTNDIEMPTDAWEGCTVSDSKKVGARYFTGTLDGQGYAIKNMNLANVSHTGLFDRLSGEYVTIKNLALLDVTLAANAQQGPLAMQVYGDNKNQTILTLDNVVSTLKDGTKYAAYQSALVESCHENTTINCNDVLVYVGGFCKADVEDKYLAKNGALAGYIHNTTQLNLEDTFIITSTKYESTNSWNIVGILDKTGYVSDVNTVKGLATVGEEYYHVNNAKFDTATVEKMTPMLQSYYNGLPKYIVPYNTTAISTVEELKAITHGPDRTSGTAEVGKNQIYVLADDIDLSKETGWNPQEYGRTYFMGTLDGQGYAIKGLNLDKKDNKDSGLFDAFSGKNVTIKNLALLDVTLDKNFQTAPLAGQVLASANVTIENVFVTVNAITFVYYQSGLITQAEYNTATITCKDVFIQVEEFNIAPATGCYAGVPRNGFMVGRLATGTKLNVSNAFFVAPTVTALEDQTYNKLSVEAGQVISLKIVGLATDSKYLGTAEAIEALATEGTDYYQSSLLNFNETTTAKMTDMIKKYYAVISAK